MPRKFDPNYNITPKLVSCLMRIESAKEKVLHLPLAPAVLTFLKKLNSRQRKALELFAQFDVVTSYQIGQLFGFKPRTRASLCASWIATGFLKIVNASNKGRKYALGDNYIELIQ